MRPVMRPSDEADYHLLAAHDAAITVRLLALGTGRPELQLFGNRAGILSLANVCLWLAVNTYRRELLSLGELPFVRLEGNVSVCIRVDGIGPTNTHGRIIRAENGAQLEWIIDEDDVKNLGLLLHRLASMPEHEYDRLEMDSGSDAEVHVRMTDARDWIR